MSIFGERLKQLRNERDLSQGELAEQLGIARNSIFSYETDRRVPDIGVLAKLSRYFGVTSDFLLGLADYRSHDAVSVGDATGLSDKAVQMLLKHKDEKNVCSLSAISEVCENKELASSLALYFYCDQKHSKMTLAQMHDTFSGTPSQGKKHSYNICETFSIADSTVSVTEAVHYHILETALKDAKKKLGAEDHTHADEE